MQTTSSELIRALSEVAPDVIGSKRWRKLVLATRRNLLEQVSDNSIGPIASARRDALQMVDSALRVCLSERLRRR